MEPSRGYGQSTAGLLSFVKQGLPWRALSLSAMGGSGSFGNGAAMRVAPVGAFFAEDLAAAAREARLSAEVTHSHPDGIAGAIAVAVATALTWQTRQAPLDVGAFIEQVHALVPPSAVRDAIENVLDVPASAGALEAADLLGNGAMISARDTVPFCLWEIAQGLGYEESLWSTVSALGDRDTNCAIVGGAVALRDSMPGIPAVWLASRERLPIEREEALGNAASRPSSS
jgi:ADP-ribosylglycohydrolase